MGLLAFHFGWSFNIAILSLLASTLLFPPNFILRPLSRFFCPRFISAMPFHTHQFRQKNSRFCFPASFLPASKFPGSEHDAAVLDLVPGLRIHVPGHALHQAQQSQQTQGTVPFSARVNRKEPTAFSAQFWNQSSVCPPSALAVMISANKRGGGLLFYPPSSSVKSPGIGAHSTLLSGSLWMSEQGPTNSIPQRRGDTSRETKGTRMWLRSSNDFKSLVGALEERYPEPWFQPAHFWSNERQSTSGIYVGASLTVRCYSYHHCPSSLRFHTENNNLFDCNTTKRM